MAKNDPKKLEKALAKKARREARKNKEQAKKDMIQSFYSGEFSLANAQKWDLLECWVSETWNNPKHLCQLLVVRRGAGEQIGVGLFLIDLGCLGIKNANATGFASYSEFQEELLENIQATQALVSCSSILPLKWFALQLPMPEAWALSRTKMPKKPCECWVMHNQTIAWTRFRPV
jgi:hypothetical protein